MAKKNTNYITISIIVIILLPVIIQYAILNNDFISKASNDGWASFFGSYLGGIISGLGTLAAVLITTNQTRKIQEENKEHILNRYKLDEKIREEEREKFNFEQESIKERFLIERNEEKERFEREYKIKIINEKIKDYEKRFSIASELFWILSDFISETRFLGNGAIKYIDSRYDEFMKLATKFMYLDVFMVDDLEKECHSIVIELLQVNFYNTFTSSENPEEKCRNLNGICINARTNLGEYIEMISNMGRDLVKEKYNLDFINKN